MTRISAHRVAGKKAFVTGAAGGLGAAIARMLARHGALVFLTDIDEEAVYAVAAAINAEHGAYCHRTDRPLPSQLTSSGK
ncbi:MAG: SDR family NAD(P)-dependent oxidoreductase [Rhodanobacter sp.]|nr:SDR family NAD(P)-dependent oxidoreductase [Rhodanobacter sp.]